MFKTLGRFINLKTIVLIAIYIFLKKEDKSITTYEIKEESMSPELLPEDYVIAVKTSEPFNRGDVVVFENNLGKTIRELTFLRLKLKENISCKN